MTDIEDLALRIKALEDRVGSRNATQLDSSSVDVGDDDSLVVSDVVADAANNTAFNLPNLQALLDTNAERLADAAAAVQEAMDAADAATEAGLAAGEEASQAADDALEKAQEALDAAEQAGGGATYTGRAPTADDPGKPGAQWFVWDSNYHVTAYYVYQDDTVKWVQTVLDDGIFGNLSAARLTSGFIDAARIAAGSLTAAIFAADAITSREIAADAVLARNIKAAEITGAKIAAATITGGNIAANTITAGNIKAGTLTANEIAAGSITANEINLDTLNGKTINGVSISGGTLSTTANANGSYAQLTGGNLVVRNTGSTATNTISTYPTGQMRILAVPASGASSSIYLNPNGTPGADPSTTPIGLMSATLVSGRLTHSELWQNIGNGNSVRWMRSDPTGNTSYPQIQVSSILNANGVSIIADTGWLTFPLASGATNADSARPARYRRIGNRVEMRGSIQMSTWGVIGNFNSSSRPTQDLIMAVATNGSNPARLRVRTDGTADVLNISSTAAYVSLDGLYFLTD